MCRDFLGSPKMKSTENVFPMSAGCGEPSVGRERVVELELEGHWSQGNRGCCPLEANVSMLVAHSICISITRMSMRPANGGLGWVVSWLRWANLTPDRACLYRRER